MRLKIFEQGLNGSDGLTQIFLYLLLWAHKNINTLISFAEENLNNPFNLPIGRHVRVIRVLLYPL